MSILGEPKPESRRRWGSLTSVTAALVAAALGGAAWLLLRHSAAEPRAAASPAARHAQVVTPAPTSTSTPVPGARTGTEREVHVVPGRNAHVTARPEAEAPRLRVDADVAGANVFFDRKFLGTTPVETRDFAPGTHRLNVSADGYEMYAETLDLGSGPHELMVRFKEVRLDEKLPVVHKHGIGSCRGTLVATTAGLRYDTSDAGDAFSAPFGSLEPLQVDYLRKNLRVRLRGGKTYNFTGDSADALLSFQKAVEAARKRL